MIMFKTVLLPSCKEFEPSAHSNFLILKVLLAKRTWLFARLINPVYHHDIHSPRTFSLNFSTRWYARKIRSSCRVRGGPISTNTLPSVLTVLFLVVSQKKHGVSPSFGMRTFVCSRRGYFMLIIDVVVVLHVDKGWWPGTTVLSLWGSGVFGLKCGQHFVVGDGQVFKDSNVCSIRRRSYTFAPGGG